MDEASTTGTAVVVGAGTMGGGIAADLANAGWMVHLLDVSAEIAAQGKERLLARRPPLLFLSEFADRILPGDAADPGPYTRAQWIVEAVAESLEIKQATLSRIAEYVCPDAIITSNTSGLSLAAMSAHCPEEFRGRFFGTHFLNPPRYLKLLEVIPIADSDPARVSGFVRFAEQVLGHRVVLARDTPGFISTRLWVTHLLDTIHTASEMGVDIETVDALTGPLIGRPRTATFRMADLVGLDIIAAVAENQYRSLPDDPLRERLRLPDVMQALLAQGRTGEKAGAGFYRRDGKTILSFDLETRQYRPRREPPVDDLLRMLSLPLPERFSTLSKRGNVDDLPGARFLRTILQQFLDYTGQVGPEIAADVLTIDRTMQWGFGWERGPFAIADVWQQGKPSNYAGTPPNKTYRTFVGDRLPWPSEPEYFSLEDLKAEGRLLRHQTLNGHPVASLIDLGDGVFCLEFQTKMNTFLPETCNFIEEALQQTAESGAGLVIGNQGPHFSAGYNLERLVSHMESGNLTAIEQEMRACQQVFQAIKYAPIPVVAAVHGFTLGAGCECALHCAAIQASPELQIGLPEALVGVLPCGGGTKEVLLRIWERAGANADPLEVTRQALRTLILPKNSENAYAARQAGWLRDTDGISRNADRCLYEAKERAISLLKAGYSAPQPDLLWAVGAAGLSLLRAEVNEMRSDGTLTGHDARIADRIARVLCGDGAAELQPEQTFLVREREAFLELCRELASLERMRHLLQTGKHLRN